MPSIDRLRSVKKYHEKKILKKKNVVSCGIGNKTVRGEDTGELCMVIGVSRKVSFASLSSADVIPHSIEGCNTDVVEIGIQKAQVTDKFRPAPGGSSIGHIGISAGTLGCLVERINPLFTDLPEVFILSNNHVLADSNAGSLGDSILQPGPADGGKAEDKIGWLEAFVPIDFGSGTLPPDCGIADFVTKALNFVARLVGSSHQLRPYLPQATPNLVDAAIAKPVSVDSVTSEIRRIGVPTGTASIGLGEAVKKCGRTTNLTTGSVLQTDVTVQVQYGAGMIATFEDQLMSGEMSAGGDSGSIILDSEDRVVGLLFAGSDTTTIFSPIENVLRALGITIKTD